MQFTRESILVGTIRAFCTAFAVMLGITIAAGLAVFAIGSTGKPDFLPTPSSLTISPDADGSREILHLSSPAILRLDIHGVIGEGDLTAAAIDNLLLDSREDFLAHDRVKGVLLHMDTPGGLASDADTIYHALLDYKAKYKVPIYAFVDGLCASGGMYIASACDKIYSTSSSIIGSIGVIMGPSFNFSGAMEKYGIQAVTITQGKDKDALNPFRPWVAGEDESIRTITAELYDQFVNYVVKARPTLDKQKLVDEYGAQVYIAEKAMEYGYIDQGRSNYSEALNALTTAANIHQEEKYQVVLLSPPHSLLSDLMSLKPSTLFQGKLKHVFQMGPIPEEFSGKPLFLYVPNP